MISAEALELASLLPVAFRLNINVASIYAQILPFIL
jgi:hypothetical protein